MERETYRKTCVLTVVCVLALAVSYAGGAFIPERLAEISARYVEAIHVMSDDPNQILLGTLNHGAGCGGGTPASIWQLTLNPTTGVVTSLEQKQSLTKIQNVRETIFESSDGTLFTGGGWCGYKPPYYSVDGGETWRSADAGTHPPNSTFSYAELNGQVYAGTGYDPYHAQVYRWLGGGTWQRVLDIPPHRTIFATMTTHDGQLFVGSHIYGWGSSPGGVPVYISSDGNTFSPTAGIPDNQSVEQLFCAGEQLFALTFTYAGTDAGIYKWTGSDWQYRADYTPEESWMGRQIAVSEAGNLYAYGRLPGDSVPGICRSDDLGLSWSRIVEFPGPDIVNWAVRDNNLYFTTEQDAGGMSYVYRLRLGPRIGVSATMLETSFEAGAGEYGLGLLTVGSQADIVVQKDDDQITYDAGSFLMSSSLFDDKSNPMLAWGDFQGGEICVKDAFGEDLLTGNVVFLELRESHDGEDVLVATGTFEVTGGSLPFSVDEGAIYQMIFQLDGSIEDFSGDFSGVSNITLTPVPEPAALLLLAAGGLAMLLRSRAGKSSS